VEAEGKLYRQAGHFDVEVSSGIDWFDLNVKADFGGVSAPLPRLLAALRKGETLVQLDDGTFGMLPEEWLKKYGGLAAVGKEEGDAVRFSRTQVGLLDALLAAQPQARFDETFGRTRDELHRFAGVAPQDPPATFTGELRPYQREALGWFDFLRRFGFGGCLADDMGLGKTVQVLALLDARRGEERRKPALVVVPRSLVFNWMQEAGRFAPRLKVLDHSTPFRDKDAAALGGYDVVLTTYGTLRKDAVYLKDVEFDYVVLDEAQAIKNAASESAKAVRLLQGNHRLALSGTPVQNHLGDLWSLFDFLNPGMLGRVTAFNGSPAKSADDETRRMLSRGLRPFILRRTKEQVAKELPPRVEQTIYCELEAEQRKMYDELREHYRQSLLGQIEREGMAKAKIQILEALLRLRQAAIHPGLIDKKRVAETSAKLDMLLPQLGEITEEGHKALVFSQFTGMLAILKKKLDAEKIPYEYLDGKTKDRQARVERFQADPTCKLFLISLKAGGVGLNLTGADYVFLLDPWWNPAVEAQAIDRTHRIGQTKQVFAFRLIAKGTVEEKVLALQESKRDLADAIINADNSLIRSIKREDLEMLLS
jgi:SNF2 family DNA or RNA helicase